MENQIIVVCCVCRKVKQADGTYMTQLLAPDADAGLSHGYCPECAADVFKEIEEIAERRRAQNK